MALGIKHSILKHPVYLYILNIVYFIYFPTWIEFVGTLTELQLLLYFCYILFVNGNMFTIELLYAEKNKYG